MKGTLIVLLAPELAGRLPDRLSGMLAAWPGLSEEALSADPAAVAFTTTAEVPEEFRVEFGAVAGSLGADVCWLPPALADAPPGLFVLDVDSTFIEQEVIELIADHAGTRAEVAAVTERAMRGELDFAESLHARVATLRGLPASVLDEVAGRVRATAGARELVAGARAAGAEVALVSGGFEEIVGPLAAGYGIGRVRANRLQVAGGLLTGRVEGPVIDRAAKAAALREYAAELGVPIERTVAIGDGANDLDMLGVAGLGIAFCAKPAVRALADTSIGFRRLDAVLIMAGLTRRKN